MEEMKLSHEHHHECHCEDSHEHHHEHNHDCSCGTEEHEHQGCGCHHHHHHEEGGLKSKLFLIGATISSWSSLFSSKRITTWLPGSYYSSISFLIY